MAIYFIHHINIAKLEAREFLLWGYISAVLAGMLFCVCAKHRADPAEMETTCAGRAQLKVAA